MRQVSPWLRLNDLAREHQVHPTTLVRAIEAGELEGYRIGVRQWRVRPEAWARYLEARRGGPRVQHV